MLRCAHSLVHSATFMTIWSAARRSEIRWMWLSAGST